MDVEQLDALYSECKRIVMQSEVLRESRDVNLLMAKVNEIVIVAIKHARSKHIISKN